MKLTRAEERKRKIQKCKESKADQEDVKGTNCKEDAMHGSYDNLLFEEGEKEAPKVISHAPVK